MIRECFKANTGIMFDTAGLKKIGLDPATLYPFVTPRPPPLPVANAMVQKTPTVTVVDKLATLVERIRLRKREAMPISRADLQVNVGTEEEEELKDALSPAYDQLKLKKVWWALEIMPLNLRYQRGDNKWVSYFGYFRMVLCFLSGLTSTVICSGPTWLVQGSFPNSALTG